MQETKELVNNISDWLIARLPETLVGVFSAVLTLIVVLLLYKVSSRTFIVAMRRQHRTEAQIKQFSTMWKYLFMLVGIIFVIVSMSASLAAMGLTVAFVSMILGWSLQRPVMA